MLGHTTSSCHKEHCTWFVPIFVHINKLICILITSIFPQWYVVGWYPSVIRHGSNCSWKIYIYCDCMIHVVYSQLIKVRMPIYIIIMTLCVKVIMVQDHTKVWISHCMLNIAVNELTRILVVNIIIIKWLNYQRLWYYICLYWWYELIW